MAAGPASCTRGVGGVCHVMRSKSDGPPTDPESQAAPWRQRRGKKPERFFYLGQWRLVEENAICIRHNPICLRQSRARVRLCAAACERAYPPREEEEESLGGISTPHFVASLFT